MSDKHKSYTQSSAFKHQRRVFARYPHLFQPIPSAIRSLPTGAGSSSTYRRSVCTKRLASILEVL